MSNRNAVLEVNVGESWLVRMAMLGIGLLLCLTLAYAAFDYVVPKAPDGTDGATRRIGWYLRSGQWQADVHTLVAAFQFVVDCDSDAPIQTHPPANQLVVLAARPDPKPPGRSQVKDRANRTTNGCPPRPVVLFARRMNAAEVLMSDPRKVGSLRGARRPHTPVALQCSQSGTAVVFPEHGGVPLGVPRFWKVLNISQFQRTFARLVVCSGRWQRPC